MKWYLMAIALFVAGCAAPTHWQGINPQATVAVAPVICPRYDWELLAGVVPETPATVDMESLAALDVSLASTLEKRPGRTILRTSAVRQCGKSVEETKDRQHFPTLEYWRAVGRCLPADFVLVPYVTRWQQRDGGEWGVAKPAAVTLDLYLIETASGQVRRYHYDEEQKGLAENLLQGKRFFKRSGKWLTPLELASEAMEDGTRELGL